MPRNVTISSRPRVLPGGEEARLREQLNLMTLVIGQLCELLDADGGVAGTVFAETIADSPASPSLIGSIAAQYVAPAAGAAAVLAFLSVPVAVNENALLAAVQVEARTAAGARAADYTGVVSLSIASVSYISGSVRDVVLRATAPGLPSVDSAAVRVTLP